MIIILLKENKQNNSIFITIFGLYRPKIDPVCCKLGQNMFYSNKTMWVQEGQQILLNRFFWPHTSGAERNKS